MIEYNGLVDEVMKEERKWFEIIHLRDEVTKKERKWLEIFCLLHEIIESSWN
jgi:hypothetical protein